MIKYSFLNVFCQTVESCSGLWTFPSLLALPGNTKANYPHPLLKRTVVNTQSSNEHEAFYNPEEQYSTGCYQYSRGWVSATPMFECLCSKLHSATGQQPAGTVMKLSKPSFTHEPDKVTASQSRWENQKNMNKSF